MLPASLPRPLAFVLSGGGAYGAGQIGQLRALSEAEIEPDLVVGSSVGALHGALVAHHGSGAVDLLEEIWSGLDRRTVFGPTRLFVRNLSRTRRPASAERLRALITGTLGVSSIEELARPFGAVATDTSNGSPVVLRHGSLADALAASAAIPGLFPPVTIGGRVLIDGGVAANLPLRQAVDLGAASIISFDVLPESIATGERPGPFAGLLQAGTILLRNQHAQVVDDVPVLALPSASPPDAGLFAFRRWEEFRDAGYRAALRALAD